MTVYDRIKELAEKRKMTVSEVEIALGMGTNSLYAWKKKIPNGASLEKAADYFGVTVDYLLGREEKDDSILSNEEDQILAYFRMESEDMSEEEKKEYATSFRKLLKAAKVMQDDDSNWKI